MSHHYNTRFQAKRKTMPHSNASDASDARNASDVSDASNANDASNASKYELTAEDKHAFKVIKDLLHRCELCYIKLERIKIVIEIFIYLSHHRHLVFHHPRLAEIIQVKIKEFRGVRQTEEFLLEREISGDNIYAAIHRAKTVGVLNHLEMVMRRFDPIQ